MLISWQCGHGPPVERRIFLFISKVAAKEEKKTSPIMQSNVTGRETDCEADPGSWTSRMLLFVQSDYNNNHKVSEPFATEFMTQTNLISTRTPGD
jgi:hypothetical protein